MTMPAPRPFLRDPGRMAAAAVAAGIELALALALIAGLAAGDVVPSPSAIVASMWTAPPPPEKKPPPPPAPQHHAAAGKAAPPARKAEAASPVYASPRLIATPTIPAAPVPAQGNGFKGGAAPFDGNGSGAGGVGTGTGSGGDGDGDGDGGSDPDLIAGRIKGSDTPPALRHRPFHGTTAAEVMVGTDGRVSGCRVIESSGSGELDALTCRLVTQRFRFTPARDGAGRAVAETVQIEHTWDVTGDFADTPGDAG